MLVRRGSAISFGFRLEKMTRFLSGVPPGICAALIGSKLLPGRELKPSIGTNKAKP
jgi:hypothetical protein